MHPVPSYYSRPDAMLQPPDMVSRDIESLEFEARKADMDLAFTQLQPGQLHAQAWTRHFNGLGMQFLGVRRAVEAQGAFPAGHHTFAFPTRSLVWQNDVVAGDDAGLFTAAGTVIDSNNAQRPGGVLMLFVPVEDCERRFSLQGVRSPGERPGSQRLQFSPTRKQCIARLAERLLQCGDAAEEDDHVELLLNTLADLSPPSAGVFATDARGKLAARYRALKRARAYIADNAQRQFYISEVCEHVGTTHRTLDRMFRSELGMTPLDYLAALRMHTARKNLLSRAAREQSVGAIARACGFRHPGRFSTEFKRYFGVSPSQLHSRREIL
jgi:AraC-like DNA-binding protein